MGDLKLHMDNVFTGRIGRMEVVKPSQLSKFIVHFIFTNLEFFFFSK